MRQLTIQLSEAPPTQSAIDAARRAYACRLNIIGGVGLALLSLPFGGALTAAGLAAGAAAIALQLPADIWQKLRGLAPYDPVSDEACTELLEYCGTSEVSKLYWRRVVEQQRDFIQAELAALRRHAKHVAVCADKRRLYSNVPAMPSDPF